MKSQTVNLAVLTVMKLWFAMHFSTTTHDHSDIWQRLFHQIMNGRKQNSQESNEYEFGINKTKRQTKK
jgi:hypothetical protein